MWKLECLRLTFDILEGLSSKYANERFRGFAVAWKSRCVEEIEMHKILLCLRSPYNGAESNVVSFFLVSERFAGMEPQKNVQESSTTKGRPSHCWISQVVYAILYRTQPHLARHPRSQPWMVNLRVFYGGCCTEDGFRLPSIAAKRLPETCLGWNKDFGV